MVKKKLKDTHEHSPRLELDSTYLLKIVIFMLLGVFWLRFAEPLHFAGLTFTALPIGLIIALFFIRHDHFAIDRKIEYPLVIVMAVISYFFDAGIII